MFLKCYQVDSTARKAIGYNLEKMNEETQTDCWININTGVLLRIDFKDVEKKIIRERSVFNINNAQGDAGYCRAILIHPINQKSLEQILQEKEQVEVKKLGRPFKKV